MAAAESYSGVEHGPLLGQLREQLVTQFLQPLLPPGVGIGQGIIVDTADNSSTQQDVIIYDRSKIAPALIGEAGVFPIDTVLYSLEVKSNLTIEGLRRSHENARCVLGMGLLRGRHQARLVLPGLIAFKSSLPKQGRGIIEKYREIVGQGPDQIFGLRMLCIAGVGYWFFDETHRNSPNWTEGELSLQQCPGLELLDLVSSIIDGYENQRNGRTCDLNSYLADTGAQVAGHDGLKPHGFNAPDDRRTDPASGQGQSGPRGPTQT